MLSVWSERAIRKQLQGTLRNKGIFIYIAKRLQELGVCRDWKQCRAKYKNLKYEYRTVKYAHTSGDATKTMKFFRDLDAILRSEPVPQLAAEENGRCCSATQPRLHTSPTADSTQGKQRQTTAWVCFFLFFPFFFFFFSLLSLCINPRRDLGEA